MKSVILINPLFNRQTAECLSLEILSSICKNLKLKSHIIDFNIEEDYIEKLKYILINENVILVGITLNELHLKELKSILNVIKKNSTYTHITVGGYFPSFNYERVLNTYPNIDSVVRGEGEETFFELAINIKKGKKINEISGLVIRENNKIICNNPRKLIVNLDLLPFPDREYYMKNNKIMRNIPHIYSSRGCYGKCSFCSIQNFYNFSNERNLCWRGRSAENVIDEIRIIIERYNQTEFIFFDDNFIGLDKERARKIAKYIINEGFNIKYAISTRPDDIDFETFLILKNSGLSHVFIGIESFSPRILEYYNKKIPLHKVLESIKILEKLELNVEIGFIMFNPIIDYDELLYNFKWLDKIRKNKIITALNVELELYEGQDLEKKIRQQGIVGDFYFNFFRYEIEDQYVKKIYNIIKEKETWFLDTYVKIKDYKRYKIIKDIEKRAKINYLFNKVQNLDFNYFRYVSYKIKESNFDEKFEKYRKKQIKDLNKINEEINQLFI